MSELGEAIPHPGEADTCTCQAYDEAEPEVGPRTVVEVDPDCPLHGRGSVWANEHFVDWEEA